MRCKALYALDCVVLTRALGGGANTDSVSLNGLSVGKEEYRGKGTGIKVDNW